MTRAKTNHSHLKTDNHRNKDSTLTLILELSAPDRRTRAQSNTLKSLEQFGRTLTDERTALATSKPELLPYPT